MESPPPHLSPHSARLLSLRNIGGLTESLHSDDHCSEDCAIRYQALDCQVSPLPGGLLSYSTHPAPPESLHGKDGTRSSLGDQLSPRTQWSASVMNGWDDTWLSGLWMSATSISHCPPAKRSVVHDKRRPHARRLVLCIVLLLSAPQSPSLLSIPLPRITLPPEPCRPSVPISPFPMFSPSPGPP